MKISQLVAQFFAVLPLGCVLDEEQVTRSLRKATRQYCGYAQLSSQTASDGTFTDIDATDTAVNAQDFDLSPSELAVIRPLWKLYIDEENALALEASRSQGADPFGRSASEVAAAIAEYEQRLPSLCFTFEIRSI